MTGHADTASMGRSAGVRAWRRGGDESGFTLVEAVVALFVLGVIFTALGIAATGSMRAALVARVEQQGIDFATQALEKARAMDFGALSMTTSDLTGDGRITTCGSNRCIDPGTGTQEHLIAETSGGIPQHQLQITGALSNNLPMTVSTYVSDPGETDADYKRVTVIASWSVGGVDRSRSVSSLVTETTRGLPLPVFKLTPLGGTATSINAGALAVFGLELSNQGAPDRWNLELTGSGSGEWTLYCDNGNRAWDGATDDVPLTNTNPAADALVDTGRIDPTASVVFWAVRNAPASTPAGNYWSKLTATSAAQPTAKADVDLLVTVVNGAVTGGGGSGEVSAVPGAPTNLQLTTRDGELAVTWTAPASAGSSAITDYVVSYKLTSATSWTTFSDGVSATIGATITGLSNGSTYDVSIAAKNSVGVGAVVTGQGQPQAAVTYTAPTKCAPATAPPTVTAPNNYTAMRYTMHNRSAANPSWPGAGVPAATSTVGQGLPLVAAVDSPQVPANTDLPVYSSNIVALEPGRIINSGGSLSSSTTTQVVDWRSTVSNKDYKGDLVVTFWVAPVSGDDQTLPWSITAEPYYANASGVVGSLASASTVTGAANSFGAGGCLGWQQVWMHFNITQKKLDPNQYLGVRVWNPGGSGKMARIRVAYDVVGDFPASFTVPEK